MCPPSAWRLRETPAMATVAPKRTNLAKDDDMAWPTYTTLELIKRATNLYQNTDKNFRLAQKLYKKDYDGRIRSILYFRAGA